MFEIIPITGNTAFDLGFSLPFYFSFFAFFFKTIINIIHGRF